MRGKRWAIAAIVLAGVAIVFVAWLVFRPDKRSPVSPLPPEQAQPSAERACQLMRDFEGQVLANGDAKTALDTLDKAAEQSNRAMRGDVVWVRLDSGIRAVRAGFRKNDAKATRVGIDVVRNACADFAPAVP